MTDDHCRRFEKNFKGDVVVKLLEEQPELAHGDNLEAFKRKWRYMFAYAEAGYARAYTSLNCWTLSRPVRHLALSALFL